MKKKTYIYLLALVPFLLVALLYEIVPLITVVLKSFQAGWGTGFTLENYQAVFSKLIYQKAILNSLKISLTSAIAGIIIAFLGARAAHQHQGKLNNIFMTVLNMVSNFAGIPLAFAYMILLGNAGLIVSIGKEFGIDMLANYNLYTMNGMSLIYIYFQIPLSTLLLIPAFDGVQKQWKEACTLLGRHAGTFLEKSRYSCVNAEYSQHFQCFVCQCSGRLCNDLRVDDGQHCPSAGSDRRLLHR